MNHFIFNKSLNDFSRQYLIKGAMFPTPTSFRIQVEMERMSRNIGELLLCHEGLAFKVFGENIPLAVLISLFGLKKVEQLIEQQALEFVLWTSEVMHSGMPVKGVFPLQSANYNSKINTDPEESILVGLNFLKNPLDVKTKKDIVRKVRSIYKYPPKELAVKSVQFGIEGYEKNLFEPLGLVKSKPVDNLDSAETKKLGHFAGESMEMAAIAHFGYGTVDEFNLKAICEKELETLSQEKGVKDKTAAVFKLENVPNFQELIRMGALDLKDIPSHRSKSNAVKFRKWIANVKADSDSKEFAKEYLEAVTKEGVLEKGVGKLLKTMTVSTILGGIGGHIAGTLGAASGVGLGALAQPIVDNALGLLDGYFIEGLTKGWTPRNYIKQEIQPLIKDEKT